jgi:hypothetical protein
MIVFLCSVAAAEASDGQLRVVRKGKDVVMPSVTPLTTNVIALIQSCTYHASTDQSSDEAGRPAIWAQALASDSLIHIKFAEPCKLSLAAPSNHGREDYLVDEILVGLPEGRRSGPFLVRTGRNVHAFGKYDPLALKRVAFEPALELSSVRPYSDLAQLDEKR